MALRNLTNKFEGYRNRHFKHDGLGARLTSPIDDASSQLIDRASSDTIVRVGLPPSLPPEWVDIVESIQKNVQDIKVQRS